MNSMGSYCKYVTYKIPNQEEYINFPVRRSSRLIKKYKKELEEIVLNSIKYK